MIPNHNPDLNLRPIGPNRDEDSENRQHQIYTDGEAQSDQLRNVPRKSKQISQINKIHAPQSH